MLKYQIYYAKVIVHSEECDGPIVLGRASDAESLHRMVNTGGEWRLPVAALVDKEMSRRHALVEPIEGGLRLTNLSAERSITLESEDGGVYERIGAGESREGLALPLLIRLGKSSTLIRVLDPDRVILKPLVGEPMTLGTGGGSIRLESLDAATLPGSRIESSIRAAERGELASSGDDVGGVLRARCASRGEYHRPGPMPGPIATR